MDTGRGAPHTGVCWGEIWEGQWGVESWGEIAWGEMPDIGDGEEGSKLHCHVYVLHVYVLHAAILHVLHMYSKT